MYSSKDHVHIFTESGWPFGDKCYIINNFIILFIEEAVMKGIFSNSGHSKGLFYLMTSKGKPFFNSAFLSDLMYR